MLRLQHLSKNSERDIPVVKLLECSGFAVTLLMKLVWGVRTVLLSVRA